MRKISLLLVFSKISERIRTSIVWFKKQPWKGFAITLGAVSAVVGIVAGGIEIYKYLYEENYQPTWISSAMFLSKEVQILLVHEDNEHGGASNIDLSIYENRNRAWKEIFNEHIPYVADIVDNGYVSAIYKVEAPPQSFLTCIHNNEDKFYRIDSWSKPRNNDEPFFEYRRDKPSTIIAKSKADSCSAAIEQVASN